MLKVIWRNQDVETTTEVVEASMHESYPKLGRITKQVNFFSFVKLSYLGFRTKPFVGRESCDTPILGRLSTLVLV